jgi:hypothetical protein
MNAYLRRALLDIHRRKIEMALDSVIRLTERNDALGTPRDGFESQIAGARASDIARLTVMAKTEMHGFEETLRA